MSADRILSADECDATARRVFAFARGDGETRVRLSSWWNGEVRWARNRVSLASDRRDIRVTLWRDVGAGRGHVGTNQLDDDSLEAAVRAAERAATKDAIERRPVPFIPPVPRVERPQSAIWSEATYHVTPETRGDAARGLVARAEAQGMQSAGYIEMRAGATALLSSKRIGGTPGPWDMPYVRWTQAQCSMTVRNPEGTGSGWAGLSNYDWGRIDPSALAERALQKCLASRNPVALEPGRYTVIFEPQAVADLFEIVASSLDRVSAEQGNGPWTLAADDALQIVRTKLGLKVIDERITVNHDLADPELGIVPTPWMEPVTWFDRGVLTALAYDRSYALWRLNENTPRRGMIGYRMSGGVTSVEDMIRTTTRGLLVTRLSNIATLDPQTLVSTGLTRDGLWLIEHGQISKAVKNLRFTESPLFALSSVEQLGVPTPVFRPVLSPYEDDAPLSPAIVPPLKVRDFSFTSAIDAI
jgi:predicted Zn-dependent protease